MRHDLSTQLGWQGRGQLRLPRKPGPLWQRWLRRAAKLWNKTLDERPGSLLQQALQSSVQLADGGHPLAQQSWAAQLASGLAPAGMQLDLQQPAPVDLGEQGKAAQRRQVTQFQEALAKGGASRLEHYVHNMVGALNMAPAMFGQREMYLDAIRCRQDREGLAQLCTGSHWARKRPAAGRSAPETREFVLTATSALKVPPTCCSPSPFTPRCASTFPTCLPHPPHRFLRRKPCRLASFAAACHQRWQAATTALPAFSP